MISTSAFTRPTALAQLRDRRVFLIDASEKPLAGTRLEINTQEVAERCRALHPRAIIVIKATVYDALFTALGSAGLPAVDKRIPLPGSGRQREFVGAFADALAQTGWENGGVDR